MSIFDFSDYRLFLRKHIESLPKKGRGSVNRIAAHLGVHSSFVSQVLTSTRDFSLEQAHLLCSFMGLKAIETDYFMLLVERDRAGTKLLKDYFTEKLDRLKKDSLEIASRIPQDRGLTDYERSVFYSSWLYSAIRLWTSVGDGKTLDEVAQRFSLPRAKAIKILQFLAEIQLCTEINGRYKMGAQRIHLDRKSPFITKMHSNWRIKSIEASESLDDTEMMFTAPLSVSKKDFEQIREQLVALIQSVSEKVTASDPEDIACLNIDFFWID